MKVNEITGITEEQFEQLAEKQDACYHKVKSRYKVWPSAYASGVMSFHFMARTGETYGARYFLLHQPNSRP